MAHASLYRGQDAHAPRGSALKPTEYIMLQQRNAVAAFYFSANCYTGTNIS